VILVIAGVEHPHFFIRSFAPMSDWKRFTANIVAVGTALMSRPPHRSGRAALPHPALTAGDDASSHGGNTTYPHQRTVHARSGTESDRHVLLAGIPRSQAPFLHPLRNRWPGLVRRLRRYYEPVRLPMSVHHRRTSLDFPTRPTTFTAVGRHGISRFSCEVSPYVHRVSDRAGPRRISRYRCAGWSLPLSPTASASRRKRLSRLNTWPARAPVNASTPSSRTAPHDSGSVWVATPSPYDSFIHNTSPV
jgi:hypothetical protein